MKQKRKTRDAFTLVELMITLGILAVVIMIVTQLAIFVGLEQRRTLRQELALLEAANALEQAMALPATDFTPQRLAEISLSEEAQQQLPGAQLDIQTDATKKPTGHKITVRLTWDQPKLAVAPVSLVAWRFSTAHPTSTRETSDEDEQ